MLCGRAQTQPGGGTGGGSAPSSGSQGIPVAPEGGAGGGARQFPLPQHLSIFYCLQPMVLLSAGGHSRIPTSQRACLACSGAGGGSESGSPGGARAGAGAGEWEGQTATRGQGKGQPECCNDESWGTLLATCAPARPAAPVSAPGAAAPAGALSHPVHPCYVAAEQVVNVDPAGSWTSTPMSTPSQHCLTQVQNLQQLRWQAWHVLVSLRPGRTVCCRRSSQQVGQRGHRDGLGAARRPPEAEHVPGCRLLLQRWVPVPAAPQEASLQSGGPQPPLLKDKITNTPVCRT